MLEYASNLLTFVCLIAMRLPKSNVTQIKNDKIKITELEVKGELMKGSTTLSRTMNPAALDPTERNAVIGIEVP